MLDAFYDCEPDCNVRNKIHGYNLTHWVGRKRSIPYTDTPNLPGGGSVQQGLSAAYEFFAMFKRRCAADKRYSLAIILTMPSAKPDTKEINALRVRRGIRHEEFTAHLYTGLHTQCELAVEEGYTTPERAAVLLEFLQANPRVAAIYPNNVLFRLLQESCKDGGWSPEIEHDLLRFIYSIYLGYEKPDNLNLDIVIRAQIEDGGLTVSTYAAEPKESRPPTNLSFVIADPKLLSAKLRTALTSEYLDAVATSPNMKDKFVGFTGKFGFGTRADCFAEARKLGAVPCEPAPYMDYLFISREFEEQGAISTKLDSAIFFRRVYGSPLILREQDWGSIVNAG